MGIGIIDADLLFRKNHRFPNLACMKISSFYKANMGGQNVNLLTDYESIQSYDKVFISKVFTDTEVPEWVLNQKNVQYGGTGFFYDKADPLPPEIEHIMPDYNLYNSFVRNEIKSGKKQADFKFYTDYSIGFLTRGCFRHCDFCVNKNYNQSVAHSPLAEFYDSSRKKICFLDDNFLACRNWRRILEEVIAINKPFQFRQGLDERLLTDEKCKLLFNSKYDGDFTFAFDNVEDYDLIEQKLKLIRKHTDKHMRFYVLCGFDRNGRYDLDFWKQDLFDTFKRIELLMRYKCYPYIMRFNMYENSPYRGTYITLARWCNQPGLFKRLSLVEFIEMNAKHRKRSCCERQYYDLIRHDIPELVDKYYFMHW